MSNRMNDGINEEEEKPISVHLSDKLKWTWSPKPVKAVSRPCELSACGFKYGAGRDMGRTWIIEVESTCIRGRSASQRQNTRELGYLSEESGFELLGDHVLKEP